MREVVDGTDGVDGTAVPTERPWSGGGREEFVDAVRRLMTLAVQASAPPTVLARATADLAAVAGALDPWVPPPTDGPTGMFAPRRPHGPVTSLTSAMPFDMVVGTCNPVAPPITIELDPPRAYGRVDYPPHFEGAPGCVHGAAIAAAFDLILTAANVVADAAGPTVELTMRYVKPTVLDETCEFESWVTRVEGRRTFSEGRLLQGGVVKVEARGEFVNMDWERINRMHRVPDDAPRPDTGRPSR